MELGLKGKVAIVTGGSSGIGFHCPIVGLADVAKAHEAVHQASSAGKIVLTL